MRPIRHAPRHEVVSRLRRARIRQVDVAALTGLHPSSVCRVIGRKVSPTSELAAGVWAAIESLLAAAEARGSLVDAARQAGR